MSFKTGIIKMAILTAIVALPACSIPPSESDGRKRLETKIQSKSDGLIRVLSFEMTEGMPGEISPVYSSYIMKYTAELEFLDNCASKSLNAKVNSDYDYEAVCGLPQGTGYSQGTDSSLVQHGKGEREKFRAIFVFSKTAQGWR
ncbi:MAG: hypothetical protein Q8L15_18920 [Methylobacter sp.]|nr:hypothetical protein [Methylobacter sp.]